MEPESAPGLFEDLEVVVQEHGLPVADSDALMTGDEATPIEDQHPGCAAAPELFG